MSCRRCQLWCILFGLLLVPAWAAAQPPSERQQPRRRAALPAPSAPSGAKRPLPDYAGRPQRAPTATEVLAWVPRVIFYPAQRVFDLALHRPLVWLLTIAEKNHVPEWLRWLFLWREETVGVLPVVFVESDLTPSAGLYAFARDLFAPGQRVTFSGRFSAGTWVDLRSDASVPIFAQDSGSLTLDAWYINRPDFRFYGIGPAAQQSDESYYRRQWVKVALGLRGQLKDLNRASFSLGYSTSRFGEGKHGAFGTRFQASDVPGFTGYDLLALTAALQLDTRQPDPLRSSGTGLRLELAGALAFDPTHPDLSLGRWEVEGSGFLDLSGAGHLLSIRLYTGFVEPLGPEATPFTELASLGGLRRMAGFFEGRFRGESAVEAAVEYRYPIWSFLDAQLFVSVGNVFDRHLRGFALDRLHLCSGVALRTNLRRDWSFDVLLGVGSNRLDAGELVIDNVRFALGVNSQGV